MNNLGKPFFERGCVRGCEFAHFALMVWRPWRCAQVAVPLCLALLTAVTQGQGQGPMYKPPQQEPSWDALRARALQLLARPSMVDERGRVLVTTASVALDGAKSLYAPWYLGDSAGIAAVKFCEFTCLQGGAPYPLIPDS